ncbi:CAP2 (YIL034C) [Zygosaccharomyces parabailii]|nr:CAP2 (YIL034C) [Zygosaccharomyces parabailii]CDH14387.1 probable F-actin-capping protein subunit beta [Zygosaccharomyces bailii ISA1307]
MSSEQSFDAALDLLRRLDPNRLQEHLQNLIQLEPSMAEDLLSSVDTPLQVKKDPKCSQREFLCCDYNRDIDSHRSPWSNQYFPELSAEDLKESPFPSEGLRELEVLANDSFDIYRDLYYEGGISSVYLWESEEESPQDYAGVVLFKKGDRSLSSWDSIHVVEVTHTGQVANYRLTSTIILYLDKDNQMTLSGNLTRQTERQGTLPVAGNAEHRHVAEVTNLGTLVEDVEIQMRTLLETVYFEKTRDIFHETKNSVESVEEQNKEAHEEIIKGIQGM